MTTPTEPIEDQKVTKQSSTEKILLIDDDPLDLMLLTEASKDAGYQILTATNGAEAISIFKQTPIAVIVADYRMPGISGIEILAKAQEITPESSRILITGNEASQTLVQAINVGQVSQILSKPWNQVTILQALHVGVEKHRLHKENRQLQKKLLMQHARLAKSHEGLKSEVQLGARVHESMLKGRVPKDLSHLKIYSLSIPSKEINGDFYEFYSPSDDHLDIVIGDAMGKGIPAALVGTAVKNQLQRFAIPNNRTQVIGKENIWKEDLYVPEEILRCVHQELIHQLIHLEYFTTLFYGRFDYQKNQFIFVDCGSTKPLHFHQKEGTISHLQGVNPPLGSVETTNYCSTIINYLPGDLFIFYSDGITEAEDSNGNRYGEERLIKMILEYVNEPFEALAEFVREDVLSFTKNRELQDDFTFIAVQIDEPNGNGPIKSRMAKFSCDLSQLQAVRDFTLRFCQNIPQQSNELSEQMQLAINEIFCNIVKHSHHHSINEEVVIDASYDEAGITFKISDQGDPFDPREIEEPSLSGDRDGGFGWYILQRVANRVSYTHKHSKAGWNHLRVYKSYKTEDQLMEILHRTEDEILIITPKFRALDAKDVAIFKETVMDIISTKNPTFTHNVVLDLGALDFVDSSGLGSFLSVLRHLRDKGGSLKLCNMKPPVRTIFELVSMHKVFEIFDQLEQAVHSYGQGV